MNSNMQIDAVILWVDGEDPVFINKRNTYIKSDNRRESTNSTRFNQVNELSYVVRSIFKFAPFVRKIFIVTDAQTPPIIKESENWDNSYRNKIKLVDHRDIFKEHLDVLPSFNACSIETMLQYIDELSEHFIYFNDDMFLIKPTVVEDWFIEGKPVVRGKWITHPNVIWYKQFKNLLFPSKLKRFGFKKSQAISASIEGFNSKYFRTYHSPRPLLKSMLIDYFNDKPDLLFNQIKHRFRTADQFLPYALIWHYGIKIKQVITTEKLQTVEVNYSLKDKPIKVLKRLKRANQNKEVLFLNLQSLDLVSKDVLQEVLVILNKITEIDLVKNEHNKGC